MSKKRKKKKSTLKRIVVIVAALAAAFAVVYVVGALFGAMPYTGISARIRAYVLGDDGGEFPLTVDSDNLVSLGACSGGFYVLSDNDLKMYDEAGELKLTKTHTFALPAVSAGDGCLLVFDRGGSGYMAVKNYKVTAEDNAKDGNILTMQRGNNGETAVSERCDEATSRLYVTDKRGEQIFIFNCAYEHIISVSLSDSGKYIAAASVGASNGDVTSTVHVFGVDYSDELYSHTFDGVTVLSVRYLSNKLLYIFTDSGIYTLKGLKELTQIKSFYSSELGYRSSAENGVTALALTKYGGSNLCELFVTGQKGKELCSVQLEQSVSDLFTDGKYVFLLAEDSVLVYNLKGACISQMPLTVKTEKVFGSSRYVYLYSLGQINREYAVSD